MAAFRHAVELGVAWVETDARLSKDGAVVLVHDDRLPFSSDGLTAVRDLSSKQLRSMDIGGGEGVPRLKDAFEEFGPSLCFDVEIKELDAVEAVVQLVKEHSMSERVILTSFMPDALQIASELAPHIERGLLIDRLTGRLAGARSSIRAAGLLGCRWLLPHFHRLTDELVSLAHDHGLGVIPWTVNLPDDLRRMMNADVDGIISDRPDLVSSLMLEA